MKSIRAKAPILVLGSLIGLSAHADPYRDWSEHVMKANKGVKICHSAYSDAIGGRTESEWKKFLPEAARTCAVLKANFNTTMITVRLNVNGLDAALDDYHKYVLAVFDSLPPQSGESPLEYYVRGLKLDLDVTRAHFNLSSLNGGR